MKSNTDFAIEYGVAFAVMPLELCAIKATNGVPLFRLVGL